MTMDIGCVVKDARELPHKLPGFLEKLPVIKRLSGVACEKLGKSEVAKDTNKSAQLILMQCQQAVGNLGPRLGLFD